jgi:cytochrome c-type biogenesis protein CcmE
MTEQTSPAAGAAPAGRRNNQTKFIIGGAVIVLAIAILIITSMSGSETYYLTVAELQAKGAAAQGQKVRVAGVVDGGSIQWDDRNLNLSFEIADESGRLAVAYHGLRPDMLQDEAEAVVEGALNAQGTFVATNLMLKCPSKYEEAATKQATTK